MRVIDYFAKIERTSLAFTLPGVVVGSEKPVLRKVNAHVWEDHDEDNIILVYKGTEVEVLSLRYDYTNNTGVAVTVLVRRNPLKIVEIDLGFLVKDRTALFDSEKELIHEEVIKAIKGLIS